MDGIAAVSQVRITRGDNFGLSPQSAATLDAFIVRADEKLTAFLELESAIRGLRRIGLTR
jgi:hypothetical protein